MLNLATKFDIKITNIHRQRIKFILVKIGEVK